MHEPVSNKLKKCSECRNEGYYWDNYIKLHAQVEKYKQWNM